MAFLVMKNSKANIFSAVEKEAGSPLFSLWETYSTGSKENSPFYINNVIFLLYLFFLHCIATMAVIMMMILLPMKLDSKYGTAKKKTRLLYLFFPKNNKEHSRHFFSKTVWYTVIISTPTQLFIANLAHIVLKTTTSNIFSSLQVSLRQPSYVATTTLVFYQDVIVPIVPVFSYVFNGCKIKCKMVPK